MGGAPDEVRDRKLIRDAGIGLLMFGALGVFIVVIVIRHAEGPVPWQAWIAPAVVTGVGLAILARSIIAAWIAFGAMAALGVGGAIGVIAEGGEPQMIVIWPAIAAGVCGMLYRAIRAMQRLKRPTR